MMRRARAMKVRIAALVAMLATVALCESSDAIARSSLSARATSGSQQANAALDVRVQVPRILYFRIGSPGTQVNTVTFDLRLAAPLNTLPDNNMVYGGALAPTLGTPRRADDDGASNGNVAVRLWTNNGSVSLDCAAAPLTSGTHTIPLSEIAVTSSNNALAHPGGTLACAARSVGATGTNNLSANWRFRYRPLALPPAGSYSTTVTYTASQP